MKLPTFLAVVVGTAASLGVSVARAQDPLPPDAPYEADPAEAPAPDPAPYAQPGVYEEPSSGIEDAAEPHLRKGFFGGAAFGFGSVELGCSNGLGCGHYAGIGFALDAGYAFAPRWGVVGELWFTGGVANADSDAAGQLVTFSANVRYWALERFWVQAGLGATGFDLLADGQGAVASGGGGGLLLAAGADLWRSASGHVVLDLRAKVGWMTVSDDALADRSGDGVSARQTTAMATLSWY